MKRFAGISLLLLLSGCRLVGTSDTGLRETPRPISLPPSAPTPVPTHRLSVPALGTQSLRTPSPAPSQTPTRTPTATIGPLALASPTEDLRGLVVTHTPAPAAACPVIDESIPLSLDEGDFTDLGKESGDPILRFLNQGGATSTIQAELTRPEGSSQAYVGEVELRDLTNDGEPEVVVSVSFTEPYPGDHQVIYTCRAGGYLPAVHLSGSWTSMFISRIARIIDLNGNGVPEILVANMTFGANDIGVQYGILEWNGQEFVGRIDPSWRHGAPMHNGLDAVEDLDHDGRIELILRGGTDSGLSTCGEILRQRTDIWDWNGEYFVRSSSELDPPTYRFEAVIDGDYAFFHQWMDRALAAYQQAIFDDSLEPSNYVAPGPGFCGIEGDYYRDIQGFSPLDERAMLEAYSRFRLVELHALAGDGSSANRLLSSLHKGFQPGATGAVFAELSQAFMGGFGDEGNVSFACERALDAASSKLPELPDAVRKVAREVSYLPTNLHLPYERYLCPFR